MDRSHPDHRTSRESLQGGRFARLGATAFILLAMLLLTTSLIHAGMGHGLSLASQTTSHAQSH
jgi:hypothetical protein